MSASDKDNDKDVEFTCPRCGSHYFGTPDPFSEDDIVECHGGEAVTMEQFAAGKRPWACGWRGTRQEAGITGGKSCK